MTRKTNTRPPERKNAWILNRQVLAIKDLQAHPAIPLRAALDEVIELGIKELRRTRLSLRSQSPLPQA